MAGHHTEVQLTLREASPLDNQEVGKGETMANKEDITQMLNESAKARRDQPAPPSILKKVSNLIWGGREQPVDNTNVTTDVADPVLSPTSTRKGLRMSPPRISTPQKRKRTGDTYEVLDNNSETDKNRPTPNPARRARKNTVPKTPLLPAKRSRGRPKKTSTIEKSSDNNATKLVSPETEEHQVVQVQEKATTQEDERPEDPEAGAESEVSEILSNPSPVKVVSQQSNGVKRAPKSSANIQIAIQARELSDSSEDKEEGEAGIEEPMPDVHLNEYSMFPSKSRFIEPESIEEMVTIAKRVGYAKRGGEWKLIKKKGPLSSKLGERYESRLQKLHTAYDEIRNAMEADDGDEIDRAHAKIEEIIGDISNEEKTFVDRLKSSKRITKILTDLYYVIIPSLVVALKTGVEIYASEETPDISALKHIRALVLYIIKLGTAAQGQPKELQPVSSLKNNSYQVTQPTRRILPRARHLYDKILKEIEGRRDKARKAKEQDEYERTAPERERLEKEKIEKEEAKRLWQDRKAAKNNEKWEAQQRELDDEEAAKRLRQRKQIRKEQGRELMRKRNHPVWGHVLDVEIMKLEERAAKRQRGGSRVRESRPVEELELGGEMNDDLFVEDGSFQFERVKMFGTNNTRSQTNGNMKYGSGDANAWTHKEMGILIEEMRYHRRDTDVWERLERRLDRGLDEIFEQAKELQRMMDDYHAKGLLVDSPADDWTKNIY